MNKLRGLQTLDNVEELMETLKVSASEGIYLELPEGKIKSLEGLQGRLEKQWKEIAPNCKITSPTQVKQFLYEKVKNHEDLSWHYKNRKWVIGLEWCYSKKMKEATLIKNTRYIKKRVSEYNSWGDTLVEGVKTIARPTVNIDNDGWVSYSNPPLSSKSSKILYELVRPRDGKLLYEVDIIDQESVTFMYLYASDEAKDLVCPRRQGNSQGFYENLLKAVYDKGTPQAGFAGLGLSAMLQDNKGLDINKAFKAELEELKSNWLCLMNGAKFFKKHIDLEAITEAIKKELSLSGGGVVTYLGRVIGLTGKEDKEVGMPKATVGQSLKEKNFLKKVMTGGELEDLKAFKLKKDKEKFYKSIARRVYKNEFGTEKAQALETLVKSEKVRYKSNPKMRDIFKLMRDRNIGTALDIQATMVRELNKHKGISIYFIRYDKIFLNVNPELGTEDIADLARGSIEGLGLGILEVRVQEIKY
jgi:hypothetical protein